MSEYAALGTAAHKLLETCMLLDIEPHAWLGSVIAVGTMQFTVDDDMADAVAHAMDYTRAYLARYPDTRLYLERRVYLKPVIDRDDCWGTLDLALDNWPIEIVIVDYKHGAGVYVEVENNEQLMTYALGHLGHELVNTPEDTIIRLAIIQPRNRGTVGPVREHVVRVRDLIAFMRTLKAAAKETDQFEARLSAGDHCRFCPVRAQCPELERYAMEQAQGEFSVADLRRLIAFDSDRFRDMLRKAPVASAWAAAVEAAAEQHLQSGGRVPGFKLVHTKRNRFWIDKPAAVAALVSKGFTEDQVAPRELLSPKQAHDLLRAAKRGKEFKDLEANVGHTRPGIAVAPESDPRPAVNPAADEFNIEDPLLT